MTTNDQTKPRSRKRRRLVRYLRWAVPILLFISFWVYMAATGRWTPAPTQGGPTFRYGPKDLSTAETQRVFEEIVYGEFGLPSDAPLELWGVTRGSEDYDLSLRITLRIPTNESGPIIGPYLKRGDLEPVGTPYRVSSTHVERASLKRIFYRLPSEVRSANVETVYLPSGERMQRLSVPPYDYLRIEYWMTLSKPSVTPLFGLPPLFP